MKGHKNSSLEHLHGAMGGGASPPNKMQV